MRVAQALGVGREAEERVRWQERRGTGSAEVGGCRSVVGSRVLESTRKAQG